MTDINNNWWYCIHHWFWEDERSPIWPQNSIVKIGRRLGLQSCWSTKEGPSWPNSGWNMLQDVYPETGEGHAKLLCPRNLACFFGQHLLVCEGCKRKWGCAGIFPCLQSGVSLTMVMLGILREGDWSSKCYRSFQLVESPEGNWRHQRRRYNHSVGTCNGAFLSLTQSHRLTSRKATLPVDVKLAKVGLIHMS